MGYGHYRDPYHDKITSVDGLITILQVCALKTHVLTMAHLSPSSPSCLKELGRRPSHLVWKTDPQGDPQDESWLSNYWAPLAGVDGLK